MAPLGDLVRTELTALTERYAELGPVKGDGLFFGFSVFSDPEHTQPDPARTKRLVEAVKEQGVLLSRIGPTGSVLKIRPPLAIDRPEVPVLIDALSAAVADVLGRK